MKKLLSFALILALALSALNLVAVAEAAGAAGIWYLNVIESEGVALDAGTLGLEMVVTLHEDGSAAVAMTGEEDAAGTWSQTGDKITLDIEGDAQEFTLADDGTLSLGEPDSGTKMVFGREKIVAEAFQPASVMGSAALEDFDGTWHATMADMMGMQLPVAALGMEMTLVIEGGKVAVTTTQSGEAKTYDAEGTLVDGVLTVAADGEESPLALKLHEDGMMSYAPDESGVIYFVREIAE